MKTNAKTQDVVLDDIREQILAKAKQDKELVKIIKGQDISKEDFASALATIEDFLEGKEICKKCKSLQDCKMSLKGKQPFIKVVNKQIVRTTRDCEYYAALNADFMQSTKYIKRYFGNELLKVQITDIDCTKERSIVVSTLLDFIENYPMSKKGILVHGAPGVGKTYTMAAFTNKLVEKGIRVASIFVPGFVGDIKSLSRDPEGKDALMTSIKCAQVLVMDDLGAEKIDAWGRDEILLPLINFRMENGLPTFFTSNYTLAELQVKYSEDGNVVSAMRLCDRVGALSIPLKMAGKSRR